MVMARRVPIDTATAFPYGAFLRGDVVPLDDFDAARRPDGSRPQLVDKESGLPIWQVPLMDPDPGARKKDVGVTVKIVAAQRPVPPENASGLPLTPVEFVGLVANPWVETTWGETTGGEKRAYHRVQWSFWAEAVVAPGKSASSKVARSGGASDAA